MDHVRQGPQPGYFQQAQHEEGWPLGAPCEPVRGAFLIGALDLFETRRVVECGTAPLASSPTPMIAPPHPTTVVDAL